MLKLECTTSIAVCLCVAVAVGCAKKDEAAVDTSTMAASTAVTTGPAPVNLSDVAGAWNATAVPVSGDTTSTTYVLTATPTTSGWTITFPGRAPIPVRVNVDADSIMLDAGPYASVRRKGVQVNTNSVTRLQGGKLVGTTIAHYNVKTADSVLRLNVAATRAP